MNNNFIGQRIRQLRIKTGISANKLAKMANISSGYISDIENGNNTPSLETLYAICTALDVSMAEFFSENQPELPPDIRRLLNVIKELTPEQREYMQKFLESFVRKI